MSTKTYIKIILGIAAATFATALAVLVGDRLSTEAMAVLAGAICGVGAAIPTSLLIFAVTQQRAHQQAKTTQAPQPQYTPVIMMSPPVQIQQPAPTPPPAIWKDAPIQRHFTTIGEMRETE